MRWGRGIWGSGFCCSVTRKHLKVLCFYSLVKCHQKCEIYSKIIPTENNSFFCEEKSSELPDTLMMNMTMWNYCTKGWRWWKKNKDVRPVRPHCKIRPNVSMHASKGSLEMFVSWNQKKSEYPTLGTWYVHACTNVRKIIKNNK